MDAYQVEKSQMAHSHFAGTHTVTDMSAQQAPHALLVSFSAQE